MIHQIEECEQNVESGFRWNQRGIRRGLVRRKIWVMKNLSHRAWIINFWLGFWGQNFASAKIRKNDRIVWISLGFKKKDKPETNEIFTGGE